MNQVYEQEHAKIYGHNVWHYLDCTDIGNIHIVQVEAEGLQIKTDLIYCDNDKAEKLFRKRCRELLSGKYLG